MADKEVTRDEVLALHAAAQVLIQQTQKLLAKMDRKPRQQTIVMEKLKAEAYARRLKTFFKEKK